MSDWTWMAGFGSYKGNRRFTLAVAIFHQWISLIQFSYFTTEYNESSRAGSSWLFNISCTVVRLQGLYSLSGKTSYRQISWSLEATRLNVIIVVSLWNLTGTSAAALPMCLLNFRAIGKVQTRISRLRDFTISCSKTSYRLVNRGPGILQSDWHSTGINLTIFSLVIEMIIWRDFIRVPRWWSAWT